SFLVVRSSLPEQRGTRNEELLVLLIRRHQLLADRAEDSLIGEGGEVDEVLAVLKSVKDHDEAIDAERHRPPEKAILGREVVFAEVRDRIEELAVADEECAIRVEDRRRGVLVRCGDDQALNLIVVDTECRLKRVRQIWLAEPRFRGVALAVRHAEIIRKKR